VKIVLWRPKCVLVAGQIRIHKKNLLYSRECNGSKFTVTITAPSIYFHYKFLASDIEIIRSDTQTVIFDTFFLYCFTVYARIIAVQFHSSKLYSECGVGTSATFGNLFYSKLKVALTSVFHG
jgi:hypothetical protein